MTEEQKRGDVLCKGCKHYDPHPTMHDWAKCRATEIHEPVKEWSAITGKPYVNVGVRYGDCVAINVDGHCEKFEQYVGPLKRLWRAVHAVVCHMAARFFICVLIQTVGGLLFFSCIGANGGQSSWHDSIFFILVATCSYIAAIVVQNGVTGESKERAHSRSAAPPPRGEAP